MTPRRTLGLDELMIVNPGGTRVRTCVVDAEDRVIPIEPWGRRDAGRRRRGSCPCRSAPSRVRSCTTLADVANLARVWDGRRPGPRARRVLRYRPIPLVVAVTAGGVGRRARRR